MEEIADRLAQLAQDSILAGEVEQAILSALGRTVTKMNCMRCGELLGPHSGEVICDDCRSAFYNGYFWGIITGAAFAGSLMAWLLGG